ncbi:hypothetical protein ATANTOWER_026663 [Ataeniobius toweri]|uniref:Uncharacterized protein n=1 Tax=Ataeniobius toweri TaxID=208326 RepID=A0ABU7B8N4_9TELE|nr:hypothetical protein [Ataeniobius toweri]
MEVEVVPSYKYLGVQLNEKLDRSRHKDSMKEGSEQIVPLEKVLQHGARQVEHANHVFSFSSIQFYLYSANSQRMSSQGTLQSQFNGIIQISIQVHINPNKQCSRIEFIIQIV